VTIIFGFIEPERRRVLRVPESHALVPSDGSSPLTIPRLNPGDAAHELGMLVQGDFARRRRFGEVPLPDVHVTARESNVVLSI